MGEEHRGKFSEGEEDLPDSPEKERVGRFSDGEEELPDSAAKEHVGRFSEGEEEDPDSPEDERAGQLRRPRRIVRDRGVGARPRADPVAQARSRAAGPSRPAPARSPSPRSSRP